MRLLVLVIVLSSCALIVVSTSLAQQQPAEQTAEQRFKNIQIFKGLPASQLDPTMTFISGSLGVRCNYCHLVASGFDKDDKQTKQTARRMIQMVQALNKGTFNGQSAVTCFTCHRGKPTPVSVPAVGQNLWAPSSSTPEPSLPTVKEILDRYVSALGGADALSKVTSRITKGSRIGADNVLVPEEVYQKAPDKLLTITSYPDVVFSNGYNGVTVWGHSSRDGATPIPGQHIEQIKRESVFYKELKTNELYSNLTVVGKVAIENGEAYVVQATPVSGTPEKLFFDTRTGLLVRRYTESDTVLGKLPLQIDLKDYREIDGIKQPFLIQWSIPGRSWGRKVEEVKQNVPLEDAKFNKPQ
jgi:photosynthetic reaction center cytochrome c subunit